MLAHLRLHRRAPSNPSSPGQLSPLEPSPLPPALHDVSPDARPSSSSNAASLPPTLPPIPRVTSESDLSFDLPDRPLDRPLIQPLVHPIPHPAYNSDSSFIGGVALQKQRGHARPNPSQPTSAAMGNGPSTDRRFSAQKSAPPPPINTAVANNSLHPGSAKQGKTTPSFVTPTDLQNNAASRPPPRAEQPSTSVPDPPKPKKGFLRNPMSNLLARRKTAQNVPDLSLPLKPEEPTYDPRIRGTRVHDFSAPRPRKIVSTIEVAPVPGSQLRQEPDTGGPKKHISQLMGNQVSNANHQRSRSNVSTSSQSTSGPPGPPEKSAPAAPRPTSIERKPIPNRVPPVPHKDDAVSLQTTSSRTASINASTIPKSTLSTLSTHTTRSRNLSLSEVSVKDVVIPALPKHMKSTSSRFSFDMIGAAKQEKLLEERHRQRQQEKGAETSTRDSRFDDFEDEFDYDAMDFDDDLEERIPGVNADFDEGGEEEEEIEGDEDYEALLDPDNDQENFAGFVFQRSNPTSNLTSPHSPAMLATPRDAEGKVIGFAMTKDTPDINSGLLSPAMIAETQLKLPQQDGATGLGIQGLNLNQPLKQNDEAQAVILPRSSNVDDELYFDGGLDEFEGEDIEGGEPFDESIFDLDDTDQFGRPLPGVFAQHLSMRKTQKEQKKRESDMTSRLSGHSGASESTHTSLSVQPLQADLLEKPAESANKAPEPEEEPSPKNEVDEVPLNSDGLSTEQKDKIAAYQAALAAAACQAAASGKFRRDSDPPLLAELMITSPTTTASSQAGRSPLPPDYGDEADDGFANDFDDYEFDDEAMVAEANASALANDSDGFYGQEFGFYSAPINNGGHHGPSSQLSAENLYQYANGGYFGPAGGVNRAMSGRVVSREPNLTPITERSEYSNRNSIMSSLGGVPPLGGSNTLASPGLAQLAMLAADDTDDTMSLSALLKLRTRAWGGSQASLASSRDGSPRSETGATSPWGNVCGLAGVGGGANNSNNSNGGMPPHARKGSTFSILSRDSEPGSGSASPTLTMNYPLQQQTGPLGGRGSPSPFSPQASATPSSFPPVLEDDEPAEGARDKRPGSGMRVRSPDPQPVSAFSSPTPTNTTTAGTSGGGIGRGNSITRRPPAPGHRKRGSQDSISYRKEKEEESGETRWVVERRRTAESGEVEILGREVVRQGRI